MTTNQTLRRTNLREADLQNADLENTSFLLSTQLAGADIAGAKLPSAIAEFEGLKVISEATSDAQGQARIELTDALGLTRSRFIDGRAPAAFCTKSAAL